MIAARPGRRPPIFRRALLALRSRSTDALRTRARRAATGQPGQRARSRLVLQARSAGALRTRTSRAVLGWISCLALLALAGPAGADPRASSLPRATLGPGAPAPGAETLAAVALREGSDVRRAVLIGPSGEVYEPDGRGAWVRRQRITTAGALSFAGLAGARKAIVAFGDGVVYRLAANGWTAVRLAQKGKAIMSRGGHSVAAVGRQLYALDALDGGEPTKIGIAPAAIVAIGSGKSVAVATARGVFRIQRGGQTAIKKAPAGVRALIGDEWALVDGGVVELRTGKRISWPEGLEIATATIGPDDRLIAVAIADGRATTSAGGRPATSAGGSSSASAGGSSSASAGARPPGALELLSVRKGKLERAPIELPPGGEPIGLVVDRAERVLIAFRDGRIAVRDRGAWTTTRPTSQLPPDRSGPPPATSR